MTLPQHEKINVLEQLQVGIKVLNLVCRIEDLLAQQMENSYYQLVLEGGMELG